MQLVRVRDMGRAEVRKTEDGRRNEEGGREKNESHYNSVYHTVYTENVRRENKNRLNALD